MVLRSLMICSYLMAVYWFSNHYSLLKMFFYPTLGAFSFLFMQRIERLGDVRRVIIGAIIAVSIGNLFYTLSSGAVSFFMTAVVTISLIHFFKWNAAPILAVSLIPYFAHPKTVWSLPIAVFVSLIGLLLLLWVILKLENWLNRSMVYQLFKEKVITVKQDM